MDHDFWAVSKKSFLNSKSWRLSPMLSFISFIFLHFILRPEVHFELPFFKGIMSMSCFCMWMFICFSTICWNVIFFSTGWPKTRRAPNRHAKILRVHLVTWIQSHTPPRPHIASQNCVPENSSCHGNHRSKEYSRGRGWVRGPRLLQCAWRVNGSRWLPPTSITTTTADSSARGSRSYSKKP